MSLRSTNTHSPSCCPSTPSGDARPSSFIFMESRSAIALFCRLEVPLATTMKSAKVLRSRRSNTSTSCALASSRTCNTKSRRAHGSPCSIVCPVEPLMVGICMDRILHCSKRNNSSSRLSLIRATRRQKGKGNQFTVDIDADIEWRACDEVRDFSNRTFVDELPLQGTHNLIADRPLVTINAETAEVEDFHPVAARQRRGKFGIGDHPARFIGVVVVVTHPGFGTPGYQQGDATGRAAGREPVSEQRRRFITDLWNRRTSAAPDADRVEHFRAVVTVETPGIHETAFRNRRNLNLADHPQHQVHVVAGGAEQNGAEERTAAVRHRIGNVERRQTGLVVGIPDREPAAATGLNVHALADGACFGTPEATTTARSERRRRS